MLILWRLWRHQMTVVTELMATVSGDVLMARWSLAVVVSCACGLTAVHAEAKGGFEIRIRLRVDRSIRSERVAAHLKDEAEAIWEPYGIQLEWTDGATFQPSPRGVSLDVTVQRVAGVGLMERPPILGRTVVTSDIRSWRPIHLSFDAVEKLLIARTSSRLSGAAMVMELELGRALGRVLAHEIGHVLINTAAHDQTGLMRATFTADELAYSDRSSFRLTCGAVDQLNDRLRVLNGNAAVGMIVTGRHEARTGTGPFRHAQPRLGCLT